MSDNPEKYPNVDMLAAMDSIPCKPARKNTPYLEGPRNLAKVIKCTALMTTAQYNDLLHAKGQKNYDTIISDKWAHQYPAGR